MERVEGKLSFLVDGEELAVLENFAAVEGLSVGDFVALFLEASFSEFLLLGDVSAFVRGYVGGGSARV